MNTISVTSQQWVKSGPSQQECKHKCVDSYLPHTRLSSSASALRNEAPESRLRDCINACACAQILIMLLIALPSAALSAPEIYFGEDLGLGEDVPLSSTPNAYMARREFRDDLNGVGTENFESFDPGRSAPLILNFQGTFQPLTATLRGNGYVADVARGSTNGVGRYATSGSQYWETTNRFTIEFGKPVSAFGFNGIDIGDFGGRVTATTVGGLTRTFNIPNTVNSPGGGVLFWGVIAPRSQFTRIEFGNTAPGVDYFGFDDMTIGDLQQVAQNVPAPKLGPAPTLSVNNPKSFLFPITGTDEVYLTTEALSGFSAAKYPVFVCEAACSSNDPLGDAYKGYYDPYHDDTYSLDFVGGTANRIVAAQAGYIVDDGEHMIIMDEGLNETHLSGTTGQIIIKHVDKYGNFTGYYTVYGDPSVRTVLPGLEAGDFVKAGQAIADLNGEHLHFQIRYDPNGTGLRTGYSGRIPALKGVTVGGRKMSSYDIERQTGQTNIVFRKRDIRLSNIDGPGWGVWKDNWDVPVTDRNARQMGKSNFPIYPVSTAGGDKEFRFVVGNFGLGYKEPVFVDPLVAIGYDFNILSGPLFTSLVLPHVGDDLFDLFLWNSVGEEWLFSDVLHAGDLYSFAPGGIDRFRILGIETSAGLDQGSPLAFTVGLTFSSEGSVDFTMAPITTSVGTAAVPEPDSLPLLAVGIMILILAQWRRSKARRS